MPVVNLAIKGSTQDHLDIADVRENLVLLKDGSVALVIGVSAVNFGLLSEREQEAIIFAYADFLNSLNFAVQIVIRSQQKDISHYLSLLDNEASKQTNQILSDRIKNYRNFISQTVKENNVLDKKFYIVIPFSVLELGVSSTTKNLLKKGGPTLPLPPEQIFTKAKIALEPKRDHVLRQLARFGLRAKQLSSFELINLYYSIYNPVTKPQVSQSNKFESLEQK